MLSSLIKSLLTSLLFSTTLAFITFFIKLIVSMLSIRPNHLRTLLSTLHAISVFKPILWCIILFLILLHLVTFPLCFAHFIPKCIHLLSSRHSHFLQFQSTRYYKNSYLLIKLFLCLYSHSSILCNILHTIQQFVPVIQSIIHIGFHFSISRYIRC